jgi:hypothetical protein
VWLIVDGRMLGADSAAHAIEMLLKSKSYGLVATARTTQLRFALDSLYGSPDTVAAGGRASRYESLRALLYSAR